GSRRSPAPGLRLPGGTEAASCRRGSHRHRRLDRRPARPHGGAARPPGRPARADLDCAAHRGGLHPGPVALAGRGERVRGPRGLRRRPSRRRRRLPAARRLRSRDGSRGSRPHARIDRRPRAERQPPLALDRERVRSAFRRRRPHRDGRRLSAGPARHPQRGRRHLRAGRGVLRRLRNAQRSARPGRNRQPDSARRDRTAPRGPMRARSPESHMKPMTNETQTAASSRQTARFPLVWKISLLVGLTLAIASAAVGMVQDRYFTSVLQQEGRSRAKAIANTLASALVEMPDSAIASTVQAVKKDAGVAYIEVVAANGSILAHTFEGKPPAQDPAQLKEGEKVNEVVLDGAMYIDVPAAVITGTLVHVGLDPAVTRARLHEAQTRALLLTLIAVAISLAFAYFLV